MLRRLARPGSGLAVDGSPRKPTATDPADEIPIYGGLIVNVAFLMLTSAALAGADPVQPPPAAAVAPAAPAIVAGVGGCGGGCGGCGAATDCCEGHHRDLFGKLRGLFHKGGGCGCEAPCAPACAPAPCAPPPCAPAPICQPAPAPCCDSCGGG